MLKNFSDESKADIMAKMQEIGTVDQTLYNIVNYSFDDYADIMEECGLCGGLETTKRYITNLYSMVLETDGTKNKIKKVFEDVVVADEEIGLELTALEESTERQYQCIEALRDTMAGSFNAFVESGGDGGFSLLYTNYMSAKNMVELYDGDMKSLMSRLDELGLLYADALVMYSACETDADKSIITKFISGDYVGTFQTDPDDLSINIQTLMAVYVNSIAVSGNDKELMKIMNGMLYEDSTHIASDGSGDFPAYGWKYIELFESVTLATVKVHSLMILDGGFTDELAKEQKDLVAVNNLWALLDKAYNYADISHTECGREQGKCYMQLISMERCNDGYEFSYQFGDDNSIKHKERLYCAKSSNTDTTTQTQNDQLLVKIDDIDDIQAHIFEKTLVNLSIDVMKMSYPTTKIITRSKTIYETVIAGINEKSELNGEIRADKLQMLKNWFYTEGVCNIGKDSFSGLRNKTSDSTIINEGIYNPYMLGMLNEWETSGLQTMVGEDIYKKLTSLYPEDTCEDDSIKTILYGGEILNMDQAVFNQGVYNISDEYERKTGLSLALSTLVNNRVYNLEHKSDNLGGNINE